MELKEYVYISTVVCHLDAVLSNPGRWVYYELSVDNPILMSAIDVFRSLYMEGRIPEGLHLNGALAPTSIHLALDALLNKALEDFDNVYRALKRRGVYHIAVAYNFHADGAWVIGMPNGNPLEASALFLSGAGYFQYRTPRRSWEDIEDDLESFYRRLLAFVLRFEGIDNFASALQRAVEEVRCGGEGQR